MNTDQLKEQIDLRDLLPKLGFEIGKGGNFHPPYREDKTPSVSVFGNGKKFKDHGIDKGGSCIDAVMLARGVDASEAMRILHEMYGFPVDRPNGKQVQSGPETKAQRTWSSTRNHPQIDQSVNYLVEPRKLPVEQVEKWKGKAFGYSNWTPKDGNADAHGPAIVFPVVNQNGVQVAANMRYLEDGHEPKMRNIGETTGGFFLPEISIKRAPVIWLVESPIDALTLVAAGCPAIAFISSSMARSFPFSWLNDKQRLMILPDGDKAGKGAATTLYHRAISAGITAQISSWSGKHKDPNDALKAGVSLEKIRAMASEAKTDLFPVGAPYIPGPEFGRMRSYVCSLDTTELRVETDDGEKHEPVASYRVYRMDPITIHDPTTAIGGSSAGYSSHKYLVTYCRSDSPFLHTIVVDGEDIGKQATWQKLGHLHNYRQMARILQTIGRDQRHTQESVGVVGLVWVGDKLQIVDSKNSHLTDEECIYHRLQIPSAPHTNAKPILEKMSGLLKDELGVIWLSWYLGSLMKVFLGFWPHMVITGIPSSGKTIIATKIIGKLLRCISQEPSELKTPYRRMKAISNHLYPVMFDEISRAGAKESKLFIDLLNSSFRYQLRHHGTKGKFLVAAPVCFLGQDNPIEDAAIGTKTIQINLDYKKNEDGWFMPDTPFPVREWGQWLINRWDESKAEERLIVHKKALEKNLVSDPGDDNLGRLLDNYAALQFALEELFLFSGYKNDAVWGTLVDLMNQHVAETAGIRRACLSGCRRRLFSKYEKFHIFNFYVSTHPVLLLCKDCRMLANIPL